MDGLESLILADVSHHNHCPGDRFSSSFVGWTSSQLSLSRGILRHARSVHYHHYPYDGNGTSEFSRLQTIHVDSLSLLIFISLLVSKTLASKLPRDVRANLSTPLGFETSRYWHATFRDALIHL